MEELNIITPKIVEDKCFIDYDARKKKIEEMEHNYINSLISIGFDPRGKDLLEVVTFLANELNKTKAELYHLTTEVRQNYEICRGR